MKVQKLHGGSMIDLHSEKENIIKFICDSIQKFSLEEPNVIISTFGIYICPWSGWINIALNEKNKSEEYVNQCKQTNQDWFGKDQLGEYCNNCPDFKFNDYSIYYSNAWQEEYEKQQKVKIKTGHFRVEIADSDKEGDEAINEIFFRYFEKLLYDDAIQKSLSKVKKSLEFRVGVQLLDSAFVRFRPI